MRNLKDRVAVVTGAAGGIGKALVVDLARAGMHLVLAGRDVQGMALLAHEVQALGRRCSVVLTDVRYLEQVENLLARTLEEHDGCHLMINNAGVVQAGPLFDTAFSDWQRVVDINLWGVLHGCRVFGEYFAKQRDGHIVNVASYGGLFPQPGMTMYSTTKFAVVGFTQQLRWELALSKVGVTLVIPGLIKTPILERPDSGLGHLPTGLIMKFAATPEGLARAVRRAVQSNRGFMSYGIDALIVRALSVLPACFLDPLGKLLARAVVGMVRTTQSTRGTREVARDAEARRD
jgi:NAD(P)-dependent dehydrogenase (short-subunit alcohol dehydrogenase family)